MKTSISIMLNPGRVFFSIVLALVFILSSCNEIPNEPTGTVSIPAPTLEGIWTGMDQDGNIDDSHLLILLGSSGFYQVSSDESSTDELYMEFLYDEISNSVLRITMIRHQVKGVNQPARGQEDVTYSLNKDRLSIFNKTFSRDLLTN